MEQHPVPQNVTTFQFRLIGDMTIKQFGYLVAGAILAFIAYKLPLPFVITWPLAFAFAFLGVGFAFIPVEERPMDVWVFSFFKSIYAPTQYIWSHQEPEAPAPVPAPTSTPAPAPQHVEKLQPAVPVPTKTALSGLFQQTTPIDSRPHNATSRLVIHPPRKSFGEQLAAFFGFTHHPAPEAAPIIQQQTPSVTGHRPPVPPAPVAVPPDAAVTAAMHQKMNEMQESLKELQGRLATKTITEDRVLELQKQLTDLLQQKSHMEDELIRLKRNSQADPSRQQAPPTPTPTEPHGAVRVITSQEDALKVGLPRLTNVPNVITGLIKDDTGNLLPGILVTVTNAEGVPVRALKTNKLGQFAASTPLPSATYFVEIEDPRARFTFSRVQLTLSGSAVPVLEILAKSQKTLTRERLAQEIFGGQPT